MAPIKNWDIRSHRPGAMLLKLDLVSESPGGLVQTNIAEFHPQSF